LAWARVQCGHAAPCGVDDPLEDGSVDDAVGAIALVRRSLLRPQTCRRGLRGVTLRLRALDRGSDDATGRAVGLSYSATRPASLRGVARKPTTARAAAIWLGGRCAARPIPIAVAATQPEAVAATPRSSPAHCARVMAARTSEWLAFSI